MYLLWSSSIWCPNGELFCAQPKYVGLADLCCTAIYPVLWYNILWLTVFTSWYAPKQKYENYFFQNKIQFEKKG